MTLRTGLKLYGVTAMAYVALDLLWIGVVSGPFYEEALSSVLRSDVRWSAAFGFYVLHAAGILVFAVMPSLKSDSLPRAVALGALLGLVVYSAYNLTSVATVRDFPVGVALVDMTWGSALTATVSAIMHDVARSLGVRPDPAATVFMPGTER